MLDQFGNQVGGPSIEQRLAELESLVGMHEGGINEIIKVVINLQRAVAGLLNQSHGTQQERSDGSKSEGVTANGISAQGTSTAEGTDEESASAETRSGAGREDGGTEGQR